MGMSYSCTDKNTNSVRWGRIHACTYARTALYESQSELCLLLSDESVCHLRFTVMSLTLIASLDSHLHSGRICARRDESKVLLFSWNEKSSGVPSWLYKSTEFSPIQKAAHALTFLLHRKSYCNLTRECWGHRFARGRKVTHAFTSSYEKIVLIVKSL